MHWRRITWILLGLACLAGALYIWRSGNERLLNRHAALPAPVSPSSQTPGPILETVRSESTAPLAMLARPGASSAAKPKENKLQYRLSNTTRSVNQLLRDDHAIHLNNALLDTEQPVALSIPQHLRAPGDPGAYIVQARRPVDDAFRALVDAAGSRVSYIPNNAYLVRMTAAKAQQLAANPATQAVLAYEPYYKLQSSLLKPAVGLQPLSAGSGLNLALFGDAAPATVQEIEKLGGRILTQSPGPFGDIVVNVQPPADWTTLATLPGVHLVGSASARVPANDLSRVRLGVTADTLPATTNYLGLSGSGVWVAVADSGVDQSHPDLAGRVFAGLGASLLDPNGHGTLVVGIIAGSGISSTNPVDVGTFASGSVPGADFRGKATNASLFVLPVDLGNRPAVSAGGPAVPDAALQEAAAQTNALISNNSWNYGGENTYDLAAASYDAAVRDALPGVTGSQPVLFVFSAGNAGGGDDNGQNANPETVQSPGTAKNVITVGSIEQPRNITNKVSTVQNGQTNTSVIWQGMTDSDSQVAAFSSRGNIGVGIEGEFGRFKPDLVAPGTFVVSTRSANWDEAGYYNPTNHHFKTFSKEFTPINSLSYIPNFFLRANAVQFNVNLLANSESLNPFPPLSGLPIYVWQGTDPRGDPVDFIRTNSFSSPPDGGSPLLVPSSWTFGISNTTDATIHYDILTDVITTNDFGDYFDVLSNLNNTLGPFYRYESGTSMSAADVSGTLALMQEFFQGRGITNSPALMKALLINGARSVNGAYDFHPQNTENAQGWGLINLPDTLPLAITNLNPTPAGPFSLGFLDQNTNNALATGQSKTWQIIVNTNAQNLPLRITLVWTDPPGDPAAGVKLVNDLDLVVTNLNDPTNPIVYLGNDIPANSTFSIPWDTNTPPNVDLVNNVENIYLQSPLATNGYTVTVTARRVNVNAVSAHTNSVVQDFALVISSGNGELPDALSVIDLGMTTPNSTNLTQVTNTFNVSGSDAIAGSILLGQHVGASSPLVGTNTVTLGSTTPFGTNSAITLGMTNQWHFYVITNTEGFSNAAFVTFLPADLSIPRIGVRESELTNATRIEADIDLYVSKDPGLLTLDPTVISNADKSLGPGGTEVIAYSNSLANDVYYVGVKAEDQMAAEYGLLGVFSLNPFTEDNNGNKIMRGFPIPTVIPDGNNALPGVGIVFALDVLQVNVRRAIVTNIITHEHLGDLIGYVSHAGSFAVLNNHRDAPTDPSDWPPPGPYGFIYEDNGEDVTAPIPVPPPKPPPLKYSVLHSDGPGDLRDFIGKEGLGLWLMLMVDDHQSATGRVDAFTIRLEPHLEGLTNFFHLDTNAWAYDYIDVPPQATNLTVFISGNTGPMQLYLRKDDFPTATNYDKTATINAPGGSLSLSIYDLPPLTPGRYYIGVFNSSGTAQDITLFVKLDLSPAPIVPTLNTSTNTVAIPDDAITNATIFVPNTNRVATVDVGLRVDHPRVSDLALTLISPRGTRVLLMENRGGDDTNGLGTSLYSTNVVPVSASGGADPQTNIIVTTGQTSGTLTIDYDFFTVPDQMTIYYENNPIFDSGMISGSGQFTVPYGPGAATNVTIIMNKSGNADTNTMWTYTASEIRAIHSYVVFTDNTNLTTTPIKFAVPPFGVPVSTNASNFVSTTFDFESAAPGDYVALTNTADGWSVDSNQVSVVNDPVTAQAGNNYLALADGTISRTVATVPGQAYTLSYAYRGPDAVSGWSADDATLNDQIDSNPGTFFGVPGPSFGPGFVRAGFGGKSLWFHGTSDYGQLPTDTVLLGDPDNLKLTDAFTIEAWINPLGLPAVSLPGDSVIFFRGDDRGCLDPYFLVLLPNGGLRLHVEDNPAIGCGFNLDTAPIKTNQWLHVAATFNATSGNMAIYTNGVIARQTITAARPFRDLDPNRNPSVAIGNQNTAAAGSSHAFNGYIDDLAVYRRALSASEIHAIWAAGAAGKEDVFAPSPENLAKARITAGGATSEFFGNNTNWQIGTVTFIASSSSTTVQLTGLEPGMLLDSLSIEAAPGSGPFYLPEESLEAFTGERAFGNWKLEIWDTRAGATNPPPKLLSWQLQFVFQENVKRPGALSFNQAQTNTIAPGEFVYFIVDVPAWASFATNNLISASAPVNLLFNQNGAPTGTNAGDIVLIANQTNGIATLSTNGVPPLLPGQRYYLGVQNTSASAISNVVVQVDFDITTLTNAVPLTSALAIGTLPRYFAFDVSSNATAASFQLLSLDANADLAVRKDVPLPTLANYDYVGLNPGTNDEQILVLSNSSPVALSPGRWFLGVFNRDTTNADYTVLATEYTTPTPTLAVTSVTVVGGSLCFTWTSLPGVHYYVQGLTNIADTNWVTIPPEIIAADYATTNCIPFPPPYSFFRVIAGVLLVP